MILVRIHLIDYSILNRKVLQSIFGLCWLEHSIPLFLYIFLFCFQKTQALCSPLLVLVVCNSTTIHQNVLILYIPLVMKFFIFCFSFVLAFDGFEGVGYKTGVGSFGIDSSKMLLVCFTNLAASKACINSAFLNLE